MGNAVKTIHNGFSVLMVTGIVETIEQVRAVLGTVKPHGPFLHAEKTIDGALAALEAERFDLVLLDLGLPDGEGIEAILKIRRAAGGITILTIADRLDPERERTILDGGAQDLLSRDDIEQFLPRIVRILPGRTKARQETPAAQQSMEKLVAEAQDAILVLDEHQTIRFANPAANWLFGVGGDGLTGEPFGYPATGGEATELDVLLQEGRTRSVEMRASNTEWRGAPAKLIILRDVTERKIAESALREARDELERRVQERTVELEETNTALKVLLKKREEERIHTEDSIVCNARELLLPYLQSLKNTRLDAQQRVFVDILEHHVEEILSPLVRDLHLRFSSLTPVEIRISTLLEEGKTAKEMAQILNVSVNEPVAEPSTPNKQDSGGGKVHPLKK